jgi:hypothetical protein
VTFDVTPTRGLTLCNMAGCQSRTRFTVTRWQLLDGECRIVLSRYCAAHLATVRRDLKRDGFRETAEG